MSDARERAIQFMERWLDQYRNNDPRYIHRPADIVAAILDAAREDRKGLEERVGTLEDALSAHQEADYQRAKAPAPEAPEGEDPLLYPPSELKATRSVSVGVKKRGAPEGEDPILPTFEEAEILWRQKHAPASPDAIDVYDYLRSRVQPEIDRLRDLVEKAYREAVVHVRPEVNAAELWERSKTKAEVGGLAVQRLKASGGGRVTGTIIEVMPPVGEYDRVTDITVRMSNAPQFERDGRVRITKVEDTP